MITLFLPCSQAFPPSLPSLLPPLSLPPLSLLPLSLGTSPSLLPSPNVFPVCALEEGMVPDLLHCLPNPVLCIAKEVMDEVLCLRGDRMELWGEVFCGSL